MSIPVQPLLLRSVDRLDVRTGEIVRRQDLLLEEGRIRRMGPSTGIEPVGIHVLDGVGLIALPGLIDCHAHVSGTFTPGPSRLRDVGRVFRQIARNLRSHLYSGVTTVRDPMGPLHLLRWWNRRIADGRVPGPRLVCSGPVLTAPHGYPTFVRSLPRLVAALVGQIRLEVPDAVAARQAVAEVVRSGADFIKVTYSSRDYDAHLSPLPVPPLQAMRAIVQEAHKRHRKVAVHVTWLEDLRRIAPLGIDSVEHLVRDGTLDTDTLDALADSSTVLVPTLSLLMNFLHLDRLVPYFQGPGARDCLEDVPRARLLRLAEERRAGQIPDRLGDLTFEDAETHARTNLRLLIDGGIPLALGTDAGAFFSFFGDIATELRWLVEHGMTPLEAIRCGTIQAAELLGLAGEVGTLEEGAAADILLVRGDPLEDIGVLRHPRWVIAAGRCHKIEETVPIPGQTFFQDWR